MGPQIMSIALAIWLMASPALLSYGGSARISALIAGPLAASISWIALSEVTRPVRRVNLAIGAWLLISALVLHQPLTSAVNSAAVGLLLGTLAWLPSRVRGQYGGGWSALFA